MKKILLVEDDKSLAKMYAKKLSAEGYDVFISHDGSDAIQEALNNRFDAIVLDLMLPGISGVDVLEMLRSEAKTVKIPVVVYTNYGDNFNREKCLMYGADDFILKVESTPEHLIRSIENALILKSGD